jgi:hypothetical protein
MVHLVGFFYKKGNERFGFMKTVEFLDEMANFMLSASTGLFG